MKKREVFEVLEPPPFGLERLRARLSSRRRPVSALVLAGAALGAVVVLMASPGRSGVDLVSLARGSAAAAMVADVQVPEVVGLGQTGALRVPTQNDDVVLYRVASLDSLQ
ncbi:MAG: hypothetical protein IAE78_30490 [Myxococcus sp.]|nr:hypothetical protein [Myxococcus sp.]